MGGHLMETHLLETPRGHFYQVGASIYPSVTTILKQAPKPYVERWKEKTPNWQEVVAVASQTGQEVHAIVEAFVKHDKKLWAQNCNQTTIRCLDAYLQWQKKYKFKPTESEIQVYSAINKYAGTCDLLGTMDISQYVLVDLKTSKRIYNDFVMQLAAYRQAYEETTGKMIDRAGILRLDKHCCRYEYREFSDNDLAKGLKQFLRLCRFWHSNNRTQ